MRHIAINKDGKLKELLESDLLFQPLVTLKSPEEIKSIKLLRTDVVYVDLEDIDETRNLISEIDPDINLIIFQDANRPLYPYKRDYHTLYLSRGINSVELSKEAWNLISNVQHDEENTAISIIGSSDKIVDIRNRIDKYAKKDCSIHLSGNTGTGKTLAAQRLHFLSGKKNSLVYVNSASIGEGTIADSNLFGYKKGAFTDAKEQRDGYLKRANGTTIFLDEIENLSHHTQEIMLDTIERGVYRKIGEDNETSSSFRVITASNVPLETLLKTGKLRKDFYYRIAERELNMPDLKDRMEDIPELVSFFERTHHLYKNKITNFDSFFTRSWEGNVRELFKEVRNYHEDMD